MIQAKFFQKAFYSILLTIVIIIFAAGLGLWQLQLLPNFRQKLLESAELPDKVAYIEILEELMEGAIQTELEVAKNCTFYFTLPKD